ncbi:hypothetical protein V5799_009820 [Amblyomma americanum]|uniref:Uncharacterized protein n=1 Tax=Amblyomma americanum TaxID=6943 RepID=A0AAQ4FAP1_AMBAM
MRAAVLLAVLTVAASAPSAIVKDGWVASAAFRGEPSAVAQPWHDDDASGAAKRRRDDSPAFDQIIVETLEQPAKHRPSLFLILFLFITGLFAGAVLLLLCVLCLLKAFNGQIAYRSLEQKDDNFCVVESRARPVADAMFKQRPSVRTVTETPLLAKDRGVAHSAPLQEHWQPQYGPPAPEYRQPQYAPERNRNRPAHKRPAKPQFRRERDSDEEDVDEHECQKALSNLRLDLRINQDRGRRNRNAAKGFKYQTPESNSGSSYSSGEVADGGNASKARPMLFCLNADKKAKDRDSKASLRDVKAHRGKESSAARPSNSKDSQISEIDENFFGEINASEVHQDIRTKKAGRSHGRSDSPRRASATPQFGSRATTPIEDIGRHQEAISSDQVTLEQLKGLLDDIMKKKSNKKNRDGS